MMLQATGFPTHEATLSLSLSLSVYMYRSSTETHASYTILSLRGSMSSPTFFRLVWAVVVLLCMAPTVTQGKSAGVRALYIFGDSLVDVGNNHYLPLSIIRADFPHNGIDFPGQKATGRFSNGKNAADFLAMNVGLETPPPYLSLSSSPYSMRSFLAGVNFASGGAGISDGAAKELEQCLPLNKQIEYFSEVHQAVVQRLGVEKARKHLARSLFVVVIGSNDIFRYVKDEQVCPPSVFVEMLADELEVQVKKIYDLGARMLVFVGTGPLGCCPSHRIENKTRECNEPANHVSRAYNEAVYRLLRKLKAELDDLCYSFFDTYKAVMDFIRSPESYGFTEGKAACCGRGALNAKVACLPISRCCSNRKAHVFWDFHHPTERTYQLLTELIFRGSKEYAYPINAWELTSH